MEPWSELARKPVTEAVVDGVTVRRGTRVRLRPKPGGDIVDLALDGRVARIEGVDEDLEGVVHVTVVVDDDPGSDLGAGRFPGHRFYFSTGEIEPLADDASGTAPRILVAGIGNIFLGDDGFGVALARRLAELPLPPGVRVTDFGIRGFDLAYAMQDAWDAVVLLDALPRGGTPGTLYVIEPELDAADAVAGAVPDGHGLDPVAVLSLARMLGHVPRRLLVVGCEPATPVAAEAYADVLVALSPAVDAALDTAVALVTSLVADLVTPGTRPVPEPEDT